MGSAQVEFNSQSMSAHNSNVSLVAKEISRVKEELISMRAQLAEVKMAKEARVQVTPRSGHTL